MLKAAISSAKAVEAFEPPLSCARIAAARSCIDAAFRDTPQFEAAAIADLFGGRLVVKVESINPIRSFKARGAQYFVSQLVGRPQLVCASSGNFGQALAFAARRHGLRTTVFVNRGASPLKVERMRTFGADVQMAGKMPDEAIAAARAFADATGALLVEDGRETAIAEGAGTIGVELLEWPETFDAILVPLGDGALLAGIGCWVRMHSPCTRVIGVCAAGSPAMERSWRSGKSKTAPCSTIADGIAVQTPFAESVARLTCVVDDIIMVEDVALIEAMRLAHRELGLVLEPSGAAALAGLLTHRAQFRAKLVATVLTGSNVSAEEMRLWLNCETEGAKG